MKLTAILLATTLLTGCATGCQRSCVFGFGPGNPIFNTVADAADRDDACQTRTHSSLTGARLKPDGHQPPEFCRYRGRNQTNLEIYDRSGRYIGRVRSN